MTVDQEVRVDPREALERDSIWEESGNDVGDRGRHIGRRHEE
jgi:hypothetical protein